MLIIIMMMGIRLRAESYRINNPEVRQHVTEYRNITFAEGDLVYVNAGGCVQTGGSGLTWKRYVDPQGDNAERLYHGLIWIPGATAGLETLGSVMGRSPVVVPRLPAMADRSQLFLRLGYDDDNYSDNGYYRHDDGQYGQCRFDFGAWVDITIVHQSPPTSPPPCPPKPIDLYWTNLDANLLPLNPRWGSQCGQDPAPLANPGRNCNYFRQNSRHNLDFGDNCTRSLPTVDSKESFPFLCPGNQGGIKGHANFGYATFTGPIYFKEWASCFDPADCDINIELFPPNGVAVADDNEHGALLLEFDARETILRVPSGVLPWWRDFARRDDAYRRAAIDGKNATVMGVLGFDNIHGTHSEVHPVLGLAIHLSSTPDEDVWAIMARRSGNEGGCSHDDLHVLHNTELAEMRFDLSQIGASPSLLGPGTQFKKASETLIGDADFTLEANGTLLRVPLPRPGMVVFGELHTVPAVAAVRPGDGAPLRLFRTLREAVEAARDGDTILIKPGVYADTFTVTKRITLTKWGADGTVVIGAR